MGMARVDGEKSMSEQVRRQQANSSRVIIPSLMKFNSSTALMPSNADNRLNYSRRKSSQKGFCRRLTRRIQTTNTANYSMREEQQPKLSMNSTTQIPPLQSRQNSKILLKRATASSDESLSSSHKVDYSRRSKPCRPTFIFDPHGKFCYSWDVVVSVALLYNLWIIIYRYALDEITKETVAVWFVFDYLADTIYILDIAIGFRTGFLEDGVLQTMQTRLRFHYLNSARFSFDCLAILPLDLLYLSLGYCSLLRAARFVKIYRLVHVIEQTERHSSYPNCFRLAVLIHSVLVLFHWNACLVYVFRNHCIFPTENGNSVTAAANNLTVSIIWNVDDHFYNYLIAYWISAQALTLLRIPEPQLSSKIGLFFVILELILGLVLFSTVLGYVASIVTNAGVSRKEFQSELDQVKSYMKNHSVPAQLQHKVIRWFDHLWATQKASCRADPMQYLPVKLKAEIALQVHLDTLRRVEIFQNTEPGFLCELVLKLKPMLFSPGDYVCRKGEVGKEMYIVSHGRLRVLANDGKSVLATLKEGSYFGEIAILNLGQERNRRTASVVSVGYSDLFCLTKRDIWEVLEEYPAARTRLEQIAHKRLEMKKECMRKEFMQTLDATHNYDTKSICSAPGCLETEGRSKLYRPTLTLKPPTSRPTQPSSMQSLPRGKTDGHPNATEPIISLTVPPHRISTSASWLNEQRQQESSPPPTSVTMERQQSPSNDLNSEYVPLITDITEESFI